MAVTRSRISSAVRTRRADDEVLTHVGRPFVKKESDLLQRNPSRRYTTTAAAGDVSSE